MFAALIASLVAVPLLAAQQAAVAPVFPRTITVKVVDGKAQPVSGALLELWGDERAAGLVRGETFMENDSVIPPAPALTSLRTDASGSTVLRLSSPSEVFAASAPGAGTSGLWYAEGLAGDAPTLVLKPSREVTGSVQHADGRPAAAALVRFDFRLHKPRGDWTRHGYGEFRPPADLTADAEGRFHFTVEGGFTGHAWAMVGEQRTEDVPVYGEAWGDDSLELMLPGRFHVRGTCLAPDGSPLAGVPVAALRRQTDKSETVTGEDGGFDIPLIHAGRYAIDAKLRDSFSRLVLPDPVTADVSEDEPVADVQLRPIEATTIRGKVRGARSKDLGISLEEAGTAGLPDALELSRSVWRSVRDEAGAFELAGLVPGRQYDVSASFRIGDAGQPGSQWIARQVRDVAAGTTDLEIVFDDAVIAGASVAVRCLDAVSGTPLPGGIVAIGSWQPEEVLTRNRVLIGKRSSSFVADGSGVARCTGVGFDRLHGLVVRAPGCEPLTLGPLSAESLATELRAALVPLAAFAARVHEAEGAPVPAAKVLVFLPDASPEDYGASRKSAVCDAAGEASFEAAHGEPVWIQASTASGVSALVRFTPGLDAGPVLLQLGPIPALPHAHLEVRIVDDRGDPIPGIEVRATMARYRDPPMKPVERTCLADASGVAVLDDLASGLWTLRCWDLDRGIGMDMVAVPPGRTTVVLRTE